MPQRIAREAEPIQSTTLRHHPKVVDYKVRDGVVTHSLIYLHKDYKEKFLV